MSQIQRLDSVAEITMGQAPAGESYNIDGNGIPLIAGAGDFGEVHPAPKKYTSAPGKICQAGDIILGIRATIGSKVLAARQYCLGRGVAGIRARPGLDSRYLWHWLTHVAPALEAKAKGATFKQVNRQDIGTLHIPVPRVPEQKRIAEILDKADSLQTKRQAILAKLDTLTKSIFLDRFGDPAKNPKGWPVGKLKNLGRVTTGSTPPSSKEGMFGGIIPFITPGDLESDQPIKRTVTEAGANASRTVDAGATLVCCIGTIGKIGKSKVRSAFNQQINAVEWDKRVHSEYGYMVMRFFKPTIVAWGSSTTLSILKKSSFERIEIPVPPMTEQLEFALRIERVERARTNHRVALSMSIELFSALQVLAFRGEL